MKIKRISEITAILIVLSFMILISFSHRQDLFSSRKVYDYNEGWEYSYADVRGTTELPAFLNVPENTVITLYNTVPEDADDDSAVVFRTRMQTVSVYVEDRLIYKYPEENLIGNDMPSVWNFVRLSKEDAGKEIRICLSSPYSGFSGRISECSYGDFSELVSDVLSRQLPVFRLSFLIGIIGAAIVLLSFFESRYRAFAWHRNLGILLILLAIWLCGESKLPSGKVGVEGWHYLSLVSLLFCPAFLTAYLHERWRNIWGRATSLLFGINMAAAAGCLLSEFLGGPDLIRLLPLILGLIALSLGYTALVYVRAAMKKEGESIRSELVCLCVIVLAGVAEIGRFYMTNNAVGIYIRIAILLYALNLLRICALMLYHKIRESQELEKKLWQSRAELVTSQIKPHFIYNTLNSIRYLITEDPQAARKTVYDFSTYLRSNLESISGSKEIPFSDELRHIRAYLNIEKIRFEDRLNVVEDIQAKSFLVPPLSIQPLVENAVKHGICRKMDGGTVTISSREEKDAYVVVIEDDGEGFDVSVMEETARNEISRPEWKKDREETEYDRNLRQYSDEGNHIGLMIIRFRVQEISGGSLKIESRQGEGTKVTVRFPKERG